MRVSVILAAVLLQAIYVSAGVSPLLSREREREREREKRETRNRFRA